jgi:hypothetical protein
MHIVLSIAKQRRATLVIILLLMQDHNIMMMSNSCSLLFSHTYKAIKKAKDDTMTMSSLFPSQFFFYFKNTMMAPLSSLHSNKIRKEKEKGAYLQAPTSGTTLKLLLLSHSYYHHVDIPEAPSP